MKYILSLLSAQAFRSKAVLRLAIAACAALTLIAAPVEAKRLGGGSGSKVGRPTNNAAMQRSAAPAPAPSAFPAAASPAVPAAPVAKPANKWLAPLAGVAAGVGIGALLAGAGGGGAAGAAGAGSGILGMLSNMVMLALLAGIALFIYRKFFAKPAMPAFAGGNTGNNMGMGNMGANSYENNPYPSQASAFQAPVSTSVGSSSINHPAIPDITAFTNNAKTQFFALQAAWDAGDMTKLRTMATDTLFMELAQQIANRKGAPNHTEVLNLNCELLDVRDEGSDTVATLRFTGTAREDNAPTTGFNDVWTLVKPVQASSGWLLAGVDNN